MKTRRVLTFSIALVVALMTACSGRDARISQQGHTVSLNCCRPHPGTKKQDAIVQTASRLVGARTIHTGNRVIAYDCAGVTRAIYLSQGIDLYEGGEQRAHANGVRLIYEHVRAYGRIHRGPTVRPGDLVFFDNTWDFNQDGVLNDALTHVGIVESVERNGTVVFISRVTNAIERYRMNLREPNATRASDGRLLNDYLRRRRSGDPLETGYLTGQLFAGFGTLDK